MDLKTAPTAARAICAGTARAAIITTEIA